MNKKLALAAVFTLFFASISFAQSLKINDLYISPISVKSTGTIDVSIEIENITDAQVNFSFEFFSYSCGDLNTLGSFNESLDAREKKLFQTTMNLSSLPTGIDKGEHFVYAMVSPPAPEPIILKRTVFTVLSEEREFNVPETSHLLVAFIALSVAFIALRK